jgi:hypothetical protein
MKILLNQTLYTAFIFFIIVSSKALSSHVHEINDEQMVGYMSHNLELARQEYFKVVRYYNKAVANESLEESIRSFQYPNDWNTLLEDSVKPIRVICYGNPRYKTIPSLENFSTGAKKAFINSTGAIYNNFMLLIKEKEEEIIKRHTRRSSSISYQRDPNWDSDHWTITDRD